MLLVFAVYPAHPAACDPVILLMLAILYHPISVLSLTRMWCSSEGETTGIRW